MWRQPRAAYGRVGLFFGFGPMNSALIVAFGFRGLTGLRELASRLAIFRISPLWYVVTLVLPIVPQSIGTLWGSALEARAMITPSVVEWLLRFVPLVIAHAAFSIGEELGWRGFMLPRVLARRPWLPSALIVGGLWAVWHYPIWFAVNFAITGSVLRAGAMLVLGSITGIAFSVLITWIFASTRRSLLPTLLFHGAVNANMNLIYEGLDPSALSSVVFLFSTTATTVLTATVVVLCANWRSAVARAPYA